MNDDQTESSRSIARAALSWPFDPVALAASTSREAVETAIANYRKAMIPANRITKGERAEDQKTLAKIIRSIGLRLRPDFSEDQAHLWIASIVEALDDQSLRIALAAARDALHAPIRFPGEVHAVIVEKCAIHRRTYLQAISQLERLLKTIDAPPALTAAPEAQRQAMSLDDLQAMPSSIRSLGISGGWLIEKPDGLRWATEAEQEAEAIRRQDERSGARAKVGQA